MEDWVLDSLLMQSSESSVKRRAMDVRALLGISRKTFAILIDAILISGHLIGTSRQGLGPPICALADKVKNLLASFDATWWSDLSIRVESNGLLEQVWFVGTSMGCWNNHGLLKQIWVIETN
jgi:hypothetical protein